MKEITTTELQNSLKERLGDNLIFLNSFKENGNLKLKLSCSKHGEFAILYGNFLKGFSCPECAKEKHQQKIMEENSKNFLARAKEVHPEFDYSKVDYINNHTKIIVGCPKHGDILVNPKSFLNSPTGCQKCSWENTRKGAQASNQKKNQEAKERFIPKVQNKHPDLDFSKVEYINANTPICVICPKHGEFWATPNKLLRNRKGNGCAKCKKEHFAEPNLKHLEEFKEKVSLAEKEMTNFEFGEYINSRTKIDVLCKECNRTFSVVPKYILSGIYCPYCSPKGHSVNEIKIMQYFKENNIFFEVEKTFPDLKDKSYLRFDFYIPSKNLLIEYDGQQHFKPNDKFGLKEFQSLKKHDAMKDDYVKKHNLNLLRIPYWEDPIQELKKIIL